ncbi:hypothetical protein D3C76_676830 [compost metagenome]
MVLASSADDDLPAYAVPALLALCSLRPMPLAPAIVEALRSAMALVNLIHTAHFR